MITGELQSGRTLHATAHFEIEASHVHRYRGARKWWRALRNRPTVVTVIDKAKLLGVTHSMTDDRTTTTDAGDQRGEAHFPQSHKLLYAGAAIFGLVVAVLAELASRS